VNRPYRRRKDKYLQRRWPRREDLEPDGTDYLYYYYYREKGSSTRKEKGNFALQRKKGSDARVRKEKKRIKLPTGGSLLFYSTRSEKKETTEERMAARKGLPPSLMARTGGSLAAVI